MEDEKYQQLHNRPKITNKKKLYCAISGSQEIFHGHSIFNSKETFKVIQVRKGHIRKNDLTYVLMHSTSEIVIRIDIIGATHQGIPTPHVHIFDERHNQGAICIPLSKIQDYDRTDDIASSLGEFLKYNNFEMANLQISEKTV
ncbi:MAG: hypothetical protein DUD32_06515 [Lactobacillus sp.]|nr:MAG: hypothetical protein DUD32_06515 [Lactobacillus sp.]